MIIKTSYPFMKPPPSARLIRGHRLAQGVAASWPFSENGGLQVFDLSGNGNNGVLVSNTYFVLGKFGSALKFDGIADCVEIAHSESLNIAGALTIATWVYMTDAMNYPKVLAKTSAWEFAAGEKTTRKSSLYLGSANPTWGNEANTATPLNNWTFIAATYDGIDKITYYHNGIFDGSYTVIGGAITTNANVVKMGLDGAYPYKGLIDHIILYNRDLSASEIALLYSKPFCMFERKARTALFIPVSVAIPGWVGINSSHYDSHCGDTGLLLTDALDGTDLWYHGSLHTHWFILDLGLEYNVQKVRGRSLRNMDPVDVNIYVSNDKGNWGAAVASGIATWQDTDVWQEVDITDKNGRYVMVEITVTELGADDEIQWGGPDPFWTIFDVYIDEAVPTEAAPTGVLSGSLVGSLGGPI